MNTENYSVSEEYKKQIRTIIDELKSPARYVCEGKEKDFEDNVVDNIDLICNCLNLPPIKFIDRQHRIDCGEFDIQPDIMVRHTDDTMTVFEVKKASAKYPQTGTYNQMAAIGQLLLYKTVLKAKINAPVRLALIDNKIYYRTFLAFTEHKLPITLVELQKDRLFVPYNGWC